VVKTSKEKPEPLENCEVTLRNGMAYFACVAGGNGGGTPEGKSITQSHRNAYRVVPELYSKIQYHGAQSDWYICSHTAKVWV